MESLAGLKTMAAAAYADSSFLVSLYLRDDNHARACTFMTKYAPALAFLPLHRVEVRNSLRLTETKGLITSEERRRIFKQLAQDMRDGFLKHVVVAWSDIFRRADELSEKYRVKHGQRAIDLLHVAAALESGIGTFLSFDRRQCGLAEAAGLQVKP